MMRLLLKILLLFVTRTVGPRQRRQRAELTPRDESQAVVIESICGGVHVADESTFRSLRPPGSGAAPGMSYTPF